MPKISLHHIDQIANDIRNQEITFSHLLDDLIDHVCCDVEYEMRNGLDFTDAYNKVKKKIGSRRLKEIQEETLYAVDTKYRYMKNTMKISGVAGTVLLGFASMFKIQHFAGAGILLTLGAMILALVFLPSALGVLWKETHNRNRLFLFISTFFAGILFILGTMFKIQHWSGAGVLLTLTAISGILFFIPALTVSKFANHENKGKRPLYIIGSAGIFFYVAGMLFKIQHWQLASLFMITGMILIGIVAFPLYTWLTWKDETHISAKFIFIVIGSLLIIIPGALINLNLQNTFNNGFLINQEEQQVLFKYKFSGNEALIDRFKDSTCITSMKQLHSKTEGILDLIGSVQVNMVVESERMTDIPGQNPSHVTINDSPAPINFNHLIKPFDPAPVKDFLLPGCPSRQEITKSLEEYKGYLAGLKTVVDIEKYEGLLDSSMLLPDENKNGTEISLISGLHSLEMLKNSILSAETIVLNSIAGKK